MCASPTSALVFRRSRCPVPLAQTLGYYRDEGLDVTLENLATNSKTLQSLIGGSVDVAAIA